MFLVKLAMPIRAGFLTMNRYTLELGCTNQSVTPLLKPQIARFSGSKGSGTDLGITTVCAVALAGGVFEGNGVRWAGESSATPRARAADKSTGRALIGTRK